MFVRAKTVKENQYAYLVENEWVKGRVQQKVKKYLGRILTLPEPAQDVPARDIDFSCSKQECMKQIIASEFLSRGFVQQKNMLLLEDIKVSLASGRITANNKSVVLFLNGRYLHKQALANLLDFFEPESEDDRKGKKLASALSDAGIGVSAEQFIALYKKFYS
jgi:hypothetical protein